MLTYTTEPLSQDTEVIGEISAEIWCLRAADQEVYHDPARHSAVILPVRQAL